MGARIRYAASNANPHASVGSKGASDLERPPSNSLGRRDVRFGYQLPNVLLLRVGRLSRECRCRGVVQWLRGHRM